LNFSAAVVLEVMDKEWPLWFVLLSFVGVGAIGLFASRKWPLTAVPVWGWAILGGFRLVSELRDPFVGPAIKTEAGLTYVILSYTSIGLAALLPAIGVWQNRVRKKRATSML
jgi:hypothetical protein